MNDQQIWNELFDFSDTQLNTTKLRDLNPNMKPFFRGIHTENREEHPTSHFRLRLSANTDISLTWVICDQCFKIISKNVTAFRNSDNLAFVREIISRGETVGR